MRGVVELVSESAPFLPAIQPRGEDYSTGFFIVQSACRAW